MDCELLHQPIDLISCLKKIPRLWNQTDSPVVNTPGSRLQMIITPQMFDKIIKKNLSGSHSWGYETFLDEKTVSGLPLSCGCRISS
jgi:hypothetical protein